MKSTLVKLSLFFLVIVSLISCQKEVSDEIISGNSNNPLLGTWKFAGFNVKLRGDATTFDGTNNIRLITTSDYSSFNNKGTMTFLAANYRSEALGYDVSSATKTYFYLNGMFIDSTEIPFEFSLPTSSSQGAYKVVGTDSIYFGDGFVALDLDSLPSIPVGCKFSISGNKLKLNCKTSIVSNEVDNGVTYTYKGNLDFTTTLEK